MRTKYIKNVGEKHNRLTINEIIEEYKNGYIYGWCTCDCGTVKKIIIRYVLNGRIKSCGCFLSESTSKRAKTHGKSNSSEYRIYHGMIDRCYKPSQKHYKRYGGRGIIVCDRWLESFDNFYADMGDRPYKTSLDRIDNDGNYEPSNCRWATHSQQQKNKSINFRNRVFTYNGKTQILMKWAEEYNIIYSTLLSRLGYGMSFEKAINYKRVWEKRKHVKATNK